MNLDPVRFTASLVAKVKGALAPIEARLSALEQRPLVNGKDADLSEVNFDIATLRSDQAALAQRVAAISIQKDVDLEALARKAADLVPTPKDGARGEKGEAGIDGLIGPVGPIGPQGRDGKDAVVDLDALALKAAELIPTPKDGAKGDRGEAGERGADATVDLDALALKAAELIPTPKDGTNGQPGQDAVVDLDALALKAAALVPAPRDGTRFTAGIGQPTFDGKDGDVYLNADDGEVYEWR